MNKKLIFSVLLAVCLLAVVSVVVFGQPSPRSTERWEYMVVDASRASKVRDLIPRSNELGKEGWELVEIVVGTDEMVFKRRLP